MTRQRHLPDLMVTWPCDYLIPSIETKFNRKKNERGSCQRKEIGIIACKKCTLKTTKLHWGHFEPHHTNSENIIIMGNQIAPKFYATTVPFSCFVFFIWVSLQPFAKKCHWFCLSCGEFDVKMYYPLVTGNWWDACLVRGQMCLHSQTRWRLNDGHVVRNPQQKWFFKMIFLNDFFFVMKI